MQKIAKSIVAESYYTRMASPVGELTLVGEPAGLAAILWDCDFELAENRERLAALPRADSEPTISRARSQLAEYFAGRRRTFDLPLVFHGTPFQQAVWRRLLDIPYGKTVSYQYQAVRVGGANKVRAVGNANGKNPISIIAPCHRVLGKDGSLTGFGGGLQRKRFLLELESGDNEELVAGGRIDG